MFIFLGSKITVWTSDWDHRKSGVFPCLYRRTVTTSLSFVTRNLGHSRSRTPASVVHRAGDSGWYCSAGGDRWRRSGHRPLKPGESCPSLQRVWKNTSGWCSLHRWRLCSGSGCSRVSLGCCWKWNRYLKRTGWRGRSYGDVYVEVQADSQDDE